MNNNNVPEIITNLVQQMNNPSTAFWIRNNYCITLENIQKYCGDNIAKFRKKSQANLAKEVRK